MGMHDLIEKKKRGGSLSAKGTAYMVREFVTGDIPNHQVPAMLIAVYLKGMDDWKIADLTLKMAYSGDMVDLSPIEGIKADKHSTGDAGDKMTPAMDPIMTTCGVKVVRIGGRGLRHTGGTVDKLEGISGFKAVIPREEFFRIVNKNGLALIGQSGNMVPADKKLYTLRDVTATVDSIPLITSPIMSKKLAADSDYIVLDVKTGSDAPMKSLEESASLAWEMVSIGTLARRCCCAFITNIDVPLSHAIDNSLEMEEAIEILRGYGSEDLTCVSLKLAANMLHMAGKGGMEQRREFVKGAMKGKSVLQCLKSVAESQGGDGRYAKHPDLLAKAPLSREVKISKIGCITHMGAEGIGTASVMLEVGRNKKKDTTNYSAGILLRKKYEDRVKAGEIVAVLYASHEDSFGSAVEKFLAFCTLGK